jgi:endonuclease G, mitochondrial
MPAVSGISEIHLKASDRLASQHGLIAKTHVYAANQKVCLLDERHLPVRVGRLLQNPLVCRDFIEDDVFHELREIDHYEDLSAHAQSALERVIGGENFLPTWFLSRGAELRRTVARVIARTEAGEEFLGSGFLIGPQLLLTNFHVLDWSDIGRESINKISRFSKAEFDFEELPNGDLAPSCRFLLEPEKLLLCSGVDKLDYVVVALSDKCTNGMVSINEYGYNRLAGDLGKITNGEPVYIIQHPQGRAKQVVIQNNRLIDRSESSPYLSYEANTDYGSSGAPVFNRQWEVIALHHSAEIARLDGQILAKDGSLWDSSQGSANIKFLNFNEGIRISKILNDLQEKIDRIEAVGLTDDNETFNRDGLALLKIALKTRSGAAPTELVAPIPALHLPKVMFPKHKYATPD